MRFGRAELLLVGFLVPLASASAAWGQTELFGVKIDGSVEWGGRVYIDRPSNLESAKFEEYRDIPESAFLQDLRLQLTNKDDSYRFEFGAREAGEEDQNFRLRSSKLGLYDFEFEWDQIPHIFSTTGRTLSTETGRGVFTLASPRPALSAHNAGRELDEISTRWDTARISLHLTPTPALDLTAEYNRIDKDGDRPFGMAFGSPGNNFVEVLEPIEQTIHDFRIRGTFAREQYQLQFGYHLSIFENSLNRLIADNPCFGGASGTCTGSSGNASAPATGQSSLPPDNMAHTWSLAGGVNLPMRTRVNANFSYSIHLQNDNFLPHTINPAVSHPDLALPQSDLDATVQIINFFVNATSRPLRPLTLSLKYRIYDYNDTTDELFLLAHVVDDRSLVTETRRALRSPYTKQNAEVDARWRIIRPAAFTLGAGWERWDRDEQDREVPESDEVFAKAALDVTPFDWLLGRATYKPSFRRISNYNTFAHLAHTAPEDPIDQAGPQSQSLLLRKFDEAERDRHRFDALLQLMPTDVFTTSVTGSYRFDEYIDSPLGVREEESWVAGIDFNWMPHERLSLFGGYVHERIDRQMRSRERSRNFSPPIVVTDLPDNDWVSDNIDTIDTVHAGGTAALIPKVLDWTFGANYSYAIGRLETRNPGTPTSANATAKLFPPFEDSLLRLETAFKYHFWKHWTTSLGYVFEWFEQENWHTDDLSPFMAGSNSIWLGNDIKDYTAHIVAITLGYRFN